MPTEQDLISRLMISKQIMDKHNGITRGSQGTSPTTPIVEEYQPVNATYNLPQELLSEQPVQQKTYSTEVPTEERILNSKLPDHIKQLMIEHPIDKPTMGVNTETTISNELVEKATRLMNTKANGDLVNENVVKRQPQQQVQQTSQLSAKQIKSIVRETVEDVLKENGLLTESTTKSDELFKFRVGEHIFEGKILKIKKVSK
jgi:hypothetical protein